MTRVLSYFYPILIPLVGITIWLTVLDLIFNLNLSNSILTAVVKVWQ